MPRPHPKEFRGEVAAIFHGAHVSRGTEVRVHATVHLPTCLEPGTTVPIGWVAVGDPDRILPADQHDETWACIRSLTWSTSPVTVTSSRWP